MATLAAIVLGLILLIAAEQTFAVVGFVYYCRKHRGESSVSERPVLVVLPIRGADETLADCVAGLAQQEYDNFRVQIVFDSETDPGWAIADRTLDEYPGAPIELVLLSQPRPHCSLKCSAVYEATEDLDDAEIVAFLDSDVVPHKRWLRELVAPFDNAQVGVAHGNRWYLPTGEKWGSMLRYCWNAATVVTMQMWTMPWGGTMAIRREVLEQTDIRQRWLKAGCEDVPLVPVVKKLGQQVRFVPQLIMTDAKEVGIERCLPFLDRQLLWARLYYPACWWVCSIWQFVIVAAVIVAGVCAMWGAATGAWSTLWMGAAGFLVLPPLGVLLTVWIERTILPSASSPTRRNPLKVAAAIALTNVVMLRVISVSLLTRSIQWRGIRYRIGGPWKIEMERYQPYGGSAIEREQPAIATSDSELAEPVTQ